jgi:hypothetical protein
LDSCWAHGPPTELYLPHWGPVAGFCPPSRNETLSGETVPVPRLPVTRLTGRLRRARRICACILRRWAGRCWMAGLILICAVLAVGLALVIHGTLVKNRLGINLDSVSCPRCNTVLPQVRKPRSLQQSMWGGCTCPNCGVEIDKWGREVNPTMETPAKTS